MTFEGSAEAVYPETSPGIKTPDAVLAAVDFILLLVGAVCVIVPSILGREISIPVWGGGHVTPDLTVRNLLVFWVVLFLRLILVPRSGRPALLARCAGRISVPASAVLIGLIAFTLFLNAGQKRNWPSGDTIPIKLTPISILEEGNLDLNEFLDGVYHTRQYGLFWKEGKALSAYPLASAMTALPVYAVFRVLFPAAFHSWKWSYVQHRGDDLPNIVTYMELCSAASIAALTVIIVWLFCLRASGSKQVATWCSLAFGAGTSMMSTAGIALWQHGPACLSLALMMLFLQKAGAASRWALIVAGLSAAWAYACRPAVAILLAVMGVWVVIRFRWKAVLFFIPAAVLGAAVLFWNYRVYGHPAGGYSQMAASFIPFDWKIFRILLFSPSRGLFVFSPFLLFAVIWGLNRAVRAPLSLPTFCLYSALATVVFFTCWSTWTGGACFGPRYLCEAALMLSFIMPFKMRSLIPSALGWRLFIVAVLFSCHVHILGAKHGDNGWTGKCFRGEDISRMWSLSRSQIVWTLMGNPSP